MSYKMALTLLWVMATIQISAKEITGYVKDAKSNEAIPFTNVIIKGTTKGVMADLNGHFNISVTNSDTLYFSAVGYYSKEILVAKITESPLNVMLEEKVQFVGEITVRPQIPRAIQIFDQIQEHKKENREKIQNVVDYKTYTNTTAYLAIDTTCPH